MLRLTIANHPVNGTSSEEAISRRLLRRERTHIGLVARRSYLACYLGKLGFERPDNVFETQNKNKFAICSTRALLS